MVTKFLFRQAVALFAVLMTVLAGATHVAAQTNEARSRGDVRICRDDARRTDRTARACGQVETGRWIKTWGTLLGVAATLGLSVVAARTKSGKAVAAVGIAAASTPSLAAVGSELEAAGYRSLIHLQDEQLRPGREAGTIGIAYRVAW